MNAGPNHVAGDHLHSPHEITASDAKSFLGWHRRMRRGLWGEITGEDEEEEEEDERESRERNRENSERSNEATMRE